jgi:PilZ domain
MAHLSSEPPISSVRPVLIDRHRRTSRRHTLNASVEVVQPAAGTGVTINASERGLRVAVDCALHEGDLCLIRVDDPDRPLVERARVVWARELVDGCIAGLEIIGLN